MALEDIVNVQITRQTTAVSRAGFGTVLVLGPNLNLSTSRVQYYGASGALSSLADALAGGTDAPEYLAVQTLLSQSPRPTQVAVGIVAGTKVILDDGGTYTAGNYKVKVNGNQIDEAFDTDKDTTLGNVATAIQALTEVSTAVYSAGAHTITITPATGYTLEVTDIDLTGITGTMTAELTTGTDTEDWDDALGEILNESGDWYGVVACTRTQADVQDVATWVEANEKIFGTASSDTNIIDQAKGVDTTSIAAYLDDNNLARSWAEYSAVADGSATDPWPEAGTFGLFVTQTPGSYTVMFKTKSGVTVDTLTDTQIKNATDKNANVFHEVGGVDMVQAGTVGEGEYIDVIVFVDWLKARITEDVFANLINLPKVPYTDNGIAVIGDAVQARLQIGVDNGGLADDPAPVVSVPKAADVPAGDKAARTLNNVTFTGTLAGAIHATNITGTVTL